MSDRPGTRRNRAQEGTHPPVDGAVDLRVGVDAEREVSGPVAVPAESRGGEDTRRRGWFWHWNSIVTQYAPLIGLKGVGLLNSYTVWTDRREESPHRGYAFPSQQSEADFYGEDRAELITINKILVALDLIEIRKEMVLRVDEQGRRWKVPHNFYRVKDHGDGAGLSARDVLRVAELADKDRTVYRYIRRVFSPKFSPIDRENVWVRILQEVSVTPVWARLAERAAKEERKASERTRAGHASRKGALFLTSDVDTPASGATLNNSAPVITTGVGSTSVANANNGLDVDVGETNTGLTAKFETGVDGFNSGQPTSVPQTNRTYNQGRLTTTTTTPVGRKTTDRARGSNGVDSPRGDSHTPVTSPPNLVTGRAGSGPAGRLAPADGPAEQAAIRAFEDANARHSTPAERHLLRTLAERFDPAARGCGVAELASGWLWVAAATYEAVEAGSAFVAPRRLREILGRWERDGHPLAAQRSEIADREVARGEAAARPGVGFTLARGPEIELPHGLGSNKTWAFTVGLLGTVLESTRVAELVDGTAITGYANGEVTICARDEMQAERLAGEYRELIARKLGEAMRRPVRIAVSVPEPPDLDPARHTTTGRASLEFEPDIEVSSFFVAECGLPSAQVWAAVLDQVVRGGEVSRANVDTWLRSTQLIERAPDGTLIVGAAHALAQRRIASRFAGPLQAAASGILGMPVGLEIVVTGDWLAANRRPVIGGELPDSAGLSA